MHHDHNNPEHQPRAPLPRERLRPRAPSDGAASFGGPLPDHADRLNCGGPLAVSLARWMARDRVRQSSHSACAAAKSCYHGSEMDLHAFCTFGTSTRGVRQA
ncbi:hypothetical protein Pden_3392 [Paracoccus denitrificans PD1222]|uniref:Uncharacterized protein n=1 Tax=Paracoccus denitrificans (strain Pd 1222) TaxID=318586 RepID=A1B7H1_PARDP|nr:hypothetical protein Pden_3392 [Paracoccus denitrificans PD1222]